MEKDDNYSFGSIHNANLTPLISLVMKNYLYRVYRNELQNEKFTITKSLGIKLHDNPFAELPNVNLDESNGYYFFSDGILIFSIIYKGEKYELTFHTFYREFCAHSFTQELRVYCKGITQKAILSTHLLTLLKQESIKHSSFRNRVIKYDRLETKEFFEGLQIINEPLSKSNELYIPECKVKEIKRFTYSVKNYSEDKICLRFLFSGPPGTGKTELMNTIINDIMNHATVLITNGGNFPVNEVFEFCALFEPCVLVVDDIDFAVHIRIENPHKDELSLFLQYLDGFFSNNLFVLASTNDKTLVDQAASRPGRFDLVLDISEIEPGDYLNLILRETNDEEIIGLFNEEVMSQLRIKKVTGAFIVNLIKQLKSVKKMNGNIAPEDFENYFQLSYNGFYKNNSEGNSKMAGF